MSRNSISVYLPSVEQSQSVAYLPIEATSVSPDNGIKIEKATDNKNNSLSIIIENLASSESSVTFVAGDTYPNAMLGNLNIPLEPTKATVCQLQDISRFENRDGSIYLDFPAGFNGNIIAIAKRAGIAPIS